MSHDNKSLAIVPRTLDEVKVMAAQFAKSALLPPDLRGKEADVFVTILAGQELGIPPMAALRGIHVVKGKPVLSADLMVGVVLGRGIARYFRCVEESPTSVTYETLREGAPEAQRCTWAIEDARRAGLVDGNWQKYPRAMLKARCKAMLARDVYPDVLAGCYEEDEAHEFSTPPPTRAANGNGAKRDEGVEDAEIVDESQAQPTLDDIAVALIADLERAKSQDEVDALQPRFSALPKGTPQRKRAAEAYKAAHDRTVDAAGLGVSA